jgi:hypothetical protein
MRKKYLSRGILNINYGMKTLKDFLTVGTTNVDQLMLFNKMKKMHILSILLVDQKFALWPLKTIIFLNILVCGLSIFPCGLRTIIF